MRLLVCALLSLGLLSCGGDDDATDAPTFDAGPACTLPTEVISCGGEGDDAACTAVCGMMPNPVCTENCTTPDDCADGWDCNDMGRCRPPDP